jgi:hypothetical protein
MSVPVYPRRRAAAQYLRQHWGLPCSEKTLAKLACVGGGPAYRRFGRIPVYTVTDLDEFAQGKLSKPVRSTSEYGATVTNFRHIPATSPSC